VEDDEKPVILVVDDEPANRALIRAYLDPTYALHEAPDGLTALALMEREVVDLVLLDVMMPHLSGYEVCRRIKAQTGNAYLPVILLTALGEQDDRNLGLQAGADDFLTKPVDRQELLLRVRLFIKLRQQEHRIRRQVMALEQRDHLITTQLAELRALDGFKDELVTLMVHDLRNPLSGIMGVLDAVEGSIADPGLRHDTQMALQASDRLRETLDDILQVRMLESGTMRLHREVIDAETLVTDAIASVWGAARARSVEISRIVDAAGARIIADRKLLRRAIENLLTNALKYSPAGGVVMAAVHRTDADVEIAIADRGAGIPDTVKTELFRKFGSVELAQGEARRGIGLGLYLVKLVAAAHGGRAIVRDREGGGTTFGILLPKEDRPPA